MPRKLGLLKHVPEERDIALASVYSPRDQLPDTFGAIGLPWGMLGNDEFGDCYWASAAHEVMAQAHLSGRNPEFTAEHVLDSYATYLGLYGHRALNEETDKGTDARAGAKFRRQSGVEDAKGTGHRIGAFTFIEEPDYELLKSAVHDFEGITVCFDLPQSAEEAFERPGLKEWDVVHGSPIVDGHAVAGVNVKDGQLTVISWGEEVTVTEAFVADYLQCAVVYVSGSTLDGSGRTPAGLDRQGLLDRLAALA